MGTITHEPDTDLDDEGDGDAEIEIDADDEEEFLEPSAREMPMAAETRRAAARRAIEIAREMRELRASLDDILEWQ